MKDDKYFFNFYKQPGLKLKKIEKDTSDIYLKISKEILDKDVKTFIEYEKNLIVYNHILIQKILCGKRLIVF